MITEAELYTRVMNILNSENFDRSLRPVANLYKEHTTKYSILPDPTQIKALTGQDIDIIPNFSPNQFDWFLDEFESFTNRGELNIFAGGSGSGKSLVMMNIALNWLQQGMSGVYITLELSEELTSLRTDAMLTMMGTKAIRKDIDTTSLKVKMIGKKSGQYRVKGLPAQSNVNDIRAYLKEVQIQTGIKIDFVMVDYLDLVMPVSVKVNPNDQFIKDKYVAEELRNLAKEMGILMVTASQLNRSAVDEIEFDHSHIAGGISKINTADNVFGIFTSRSMRERGKYQIQCMKSRSSTGVGQKIDLDYDIETMRISDSDPDNQNSYTPKPSPNQIMSQLKPQSTLQSTSPIIDQATGEILEPENKRIIADVQGSKLKAMLNSLKK